jgi:hypothetical protein
MHPEVVFCEGVPVILPRSHKLCQNTGLSVLPSIGEKRKVGWMGDDSHVVFDQTFPCEKKEIDGAFS